MLLKELHVIGAVLLHKEICFEGQVLEEKPTEIVFVGLAAAGKTTLLNRLVTGEFRVQPSTMGFAVDTFSYKDKIHVRAIDLGGQDVFIHTLWKQFIPRADVIVFLIDAADHSLMQKARDTLLTAISWIQNKQPILMILANKQDLPTAYSLEECIMALDLTEVPDMPVKALQMFDCSAKTGYGVAKSFDWLVSQVVETDEMPKAHVHQIYVYRSSGVLLGSTIIQPFESTLEQDNLDPSLVTGFYSALSGFAKEITGKGYDPEYQGIRNIILTNPSPGSPDLRLVHVEDKDHTLACLVVAEENDNFTAIRAVAESALAISKSLLELKPYELIPQDILQQHIAPFIYPTPSELSITDQSLLQDIGTGEINIDIDSDVLAFRQTHTTYNPTFFTKLSTAQRIRSIEGEYTA